MDECKESLMDGERKEKEMRDKEICNLQCVFHVIIEYKYLYSLDLEDDNGHS